MEVVTMSTEIDPRIVREVARTAMEMAATRRDDLDLAIRRHGGLGDMPEDLEAKAEYRNAYGALYSAAAADMKAGATVVVSWPDEQPRPVEDDSFAMVAEDCPTGPARAIAEHWFSHAALIADSVGGPEWHAIADMTRRILNAMDAEQSHHDSGACEGCGCCTHTGCHRGAGATCPTNSLGDSVCPCTED